MRTKGILLNARISRVVSCSDFFRLEVVPAPLILILCPLAIWDGMYARLVPGWRRM